ncbi:myeloid-associated differentiation marker-like protein 2 [Menidia menidia]
MDPLGGPYLNRAALCSPLGAARLCQLALGCAVIAVATHGSGSSGPPGAFCMAAWGGCFAASVLVFFLDATRLHSCLPVSWDNLTVTVAAGATLLSVTASVVFPLFFVRSECPYAGCEVRSFRLAATVCSALAAAAYGAEVALSRPRPGRASPGATASYMATPSGLLKVAQCFVGCVIFVALGTGSRHGRHAAAAFCVAVYAGCFVATATAVALAVCRRARPVRGVPFERLVAVATLAEALLYLSASVAWPVFCFDAKYGAPERPAWCPWGRCPWDAEVAVATASCLNLVLYLADLVCSQRNRFSSTRLPANSRSLPGVRC